MNYSSMKVKTIFLILSNLITGTLLFCFSIMLSRKIGSEGMGLYQLIMPIYSLFLCITGGGITVSVSKLAAEEKARKNTTELYHIVRSLCFFEVLWSMLVTLILICLAGYISTNILNEPQTKYLIYAFSPAIIFVSLSSVYKGAYYGIQSVIPPAIIDIIEKIIRVAFIVIIFNILPSENLALSTSVAVLSLSLGELSSLLLFYFAFTHYKHKNPAIGRTDNGFQLVANTIKLALPLAVNGILSTLFTTFITLIIPSRLEQTGMSHESSIALLGKLQGMVLTIIFYPTVIISSMNVLLVPALSEAVTMKKSITIRHHINTAFTVASITAFSSAAILLSCPDKIGILFYNDNSLGVFLKQLSPAIPFLYLQIISIAIMNGIGKQKNILINSTLLSTIELFLLYILLGIPKINVTGYAIDFFVITIIGLLMNMFIIKRTLDIKLSIYNILILPVLCSLFTYFLIKCLSKTIINTPVIIAFGYGIYFAIYFIQQYFLNYKDNRLSAKTYKRQSL